jgi:uncharacterized protein YoaH (UPF0181 family)
MHANGLHGMPRLAELEKKIWRALALPSLASKIRARAKKGADKSACARSKIPEKVRILFDEYMRRDMSRSEAIAAVVEQLKINKTPRTIRAVRYALKGKKGK